MISSLARLGQSLFAQTSVTLLLLSFFLTIAYAVGWIHRFVWYSIEKEARKALNGTPVTLSSFQMDLLRGRFFFQNVVVHAPQQEDWQWASPVLARIGKAYVEINIVTVLLSIWFLWEEPPLELYTIQLSDIQVFIERQHDVFNFLLLDPHNILPDPKDLVRTESADDDGGDAAAENGTEDETTADESQVITNDKAQTVVHDVMQAVTSFGRSAQKDSLHGALVKHRDQITSHLKELQTTKKSHAMQHGVKLVQQVSQQVVEKTQGVHHVVVPARQRLPQDKVVWARVGRLIVEDTRIFTQDHFQDSRSWNKPIVLSRVVVKPAEFSPPLGSAQDEHGWPPVYQPLDKILDVVWKRLLADIAKSNTGRLFETALGELLDYWMEDRGDSASDVGS